MKMLKIISVLKRVLNAGSYNTQLLNRLNYTIKRDALITKTRCSTESGIEQTKFCDHEVVVSLTTYGKRLYEVASTIESIMQGTMKPNRIVLWLEEGLKDTPLPILLQRQQTRGLEIGYCEDLRSYKKLIPTLIKYPDAVIITIDDDAIYNCDVVEKLVNTYII